MINDYSYPDGSSVNEFTDRSNFPTVSYSPPREIAKRIHELRNKYPDHEVLLMLGDVTGAFRHVPVHEEAAHMFGSEFENYVVIGLSCGFGWCGSPAFYSLAGSIINDLYESETLDDNDSLGNLHGSVWCDEHTCVEVNREQRCHNANIALRQAIVTVLGPTAVNDKKFTPWRARNKALGLIWDTTSGTVSIPTEKLDKASTVIDLILFTKHASKSDLNKLLGVLRHVASCFPPSRAFYQRIHVAAISAGPFGQHTLLSDALEDLRWFQATVNLRNRFNKIPVAQPAGSASPSVHIYMDASGTGLCALDPQQKEFIRLQYSPHEVNKMHDGSFSNSINFRELQSAVLSALIWGPRWQKAANSLPVYVCLHIDNTSAVAWTNTRLSRHPTVQLYNRLLSFAEFEFQLSFSAEHIAGKLNVMADAGSRAWSETHTLWGKWTNLSSAWSQVAIDPPFSDLSDVWEQLCAGKPWQVLPRQNIMLTGCSGESSPGQ